MVRVAFVSLLIGGMVVVGATGAEVNEIPRSSVITVSDGVPVPVPVPTRKLTKNSKASKDDTVVSEEVQDLLRLLVFATAVDLNRFLMEQSSFEDAVVENNYKEYTCTGCVGLFTSGTQLPPDEQDEFCQEVVFQVLNKIGKIIINNRDAAGILSQVSLLLNQDCNELLQCSSTPTMCCQSQGVCLATYGATGHHCDQSDHCAGRLSNAPAITTTGMTKNRGP